MHSELIKIAKNFRNKLEDFIKSSSIYIGDELRNFPGGACQISSAMLGLHLVELGYENVLIQSGKRQILGDFNFENHCWLILDEQIIIDITADQFEDCNTEIIVTSQSDFHNTFSEVYRKKICDDLLSRPGYRRNDGYFKVYKELMADNFYN